MLDVSAYPFLNEDFDAGDAKRQRHTTDVKRRELVTLNLDYKQMGVGGDTSWGARTHPEYTLPAKEYRYRYRLRPFSTTEPAPMTLSKEKIGSPVVSGDLICVGGHGLWTLPRLWKTPETPGERGV